MATRTLLPAGLMTLLSLVLPGAAAPNDGKRAPDKDANRLTGILKSVDAARGTFTLERIGVDVDEVLTQKLKEGGKSVAAAAPDAGKAPAAGKPPAKDDAPDKPLVVRMNARTKIYVKFRSSPSVANNVERKPADLRPMIGWPVTVTQGASDGDTLVATEVIAWRGTPWRVRAEK